MRLTSFTDLGLRALMRIASEPDRFHSTSKLAGEFNISHYHLNKIIAALASAGYLETRRGTGGGAMLAKPAGDVLLGELVTTLEKGTALVECFNPETNQCSITPVCKLKGMLGMARSRFIEELNNFSLADFALPPSENDMTKVTAS